MLNSCYCVKTCVDTAQLLKDARRKRAAMAEQQFNEYEEGKEAKYDEFNVPMVNSHGKVNDSGSLDHVSPANYEFNFININLPVPTYGSGLSNNGHFSNGHGPRHYSRQSSYSNSKSGAETDPMDTISSGSSDPMSTDDNDHDSSSNELTLEPPFRTDDYPVAEEDDAEIVAFSPHQMAKRVQFTDSQHILTASGNTHLAPHSPPRNGPVPRSKNRSKSLDMDELEGSETKCCPRRKDGSFAMLTMWRQ